MTPARALIAAGTALSVAGAAHAAVNARLLRRPVRSDDPLPSLTVLIPARNEAATIAACVESVQGPWDVVVLDDESTDATGELARSAGARVIAGRPVPAGWVGKVWACAQLADEAGSRTEILVFVDADVRLEPGAVPAAVGLLLDSGLDIVCPFPRQEAVTPAERLVQPLLQWSWLTTLPLRGAEHSSRESMTAACGQFMVLRRDALERAGGFTAIRGAVLDDVALVRAIKAVGGRGGVVDGTDVAGCRMYTDWPSLREGYSKSLWSAFGSEPGAVAAVAALATVWVLPPVAAVLGSRVGAVGYAAGVAGRVITGRRTGARVVPDALAHPVSVAVLCWLTGRSVVLRRLGRLQWKQRPLTR